MKHQRSWLSILLVVCLLFSMMPATALADSTAEQFTYVQNGNSGAVITCTSEVTEAAADDASLADVSVDGKTVTVTGTEGAVGIVSVTVVSGSTSETFEVPVGYTTFLFDGDSLTVYEGSDSNYAVTGYNASDEEYTPEAAENADGSLTYTNTDTYKLCVSIKKKGGTYAFSGTGSDMSIEVKKEATGAAELLLCGLDMTSSYTSPITVKKDSTSTVQITALAGSVNTLTDAAYNNADDYADNALAESAVIKGKASANVTLAGTGTLNLVCNTKNAVKIGEYGELTIEDLTLHITTAKNGLSSDNLMTINSGTITITAEADAIRTDPDAVDADAGCTGTITIYGGEITITAGSDGIQAAQDLLIYGGTFDITTCTGYDDSSFDADTSSAKGLKASFNGDDESTDTSEATNTIYISGGSFVLNTADDAVHSDGYIVITGGTFDIRTGDDAVHADTSLTLGEENGDDAALTMEITSCYEGLEAGNVYIYSGTYDIYAEDDGINAAGGSDSTDTNTGFNPGGGAGSPGGFGGSFGNPSGGSTSSSAEYSINIYGGDITVNASGDGIDSNGNLNITGGTTLVWGGGEDENPLDYDGSFYINGGTVLAAGYNRMAVSAPTSGSQKYITYSPRTAISAGQTICVTIDGTTVTKAVAPKSVAYVFYSSPSVTSSNTSISVTNETVESSTPSESEDTTESSAPSESEAATESSAPSESEAASESSVPSESEAVTESSMPSESEAVSESSAPSESDSPYAAGTYYYGDVDIDGSVTSSDALTVLQAVVELTTIADGIPSELADMNGDGSISAEDALQILQTVVSLMELRTYTAAAD